MSEPRRLSRIAICAALAALAATTLSSAQSPGSSDPCRGAIERTTAFTARVSAEMNEHGDLLVFLDTDADERPEYVLHGAPWGASELAPVLESLQLRSAPTAVRLLYRSSEAPSGFEIAGENAPLRAMIGTPNCHPERPGTDLWLAGLAHYTLSNFEPLAHLTVARLREKPLIRTPD